jgi:hypothetical protein
MTPKAGPSNPKNHPCNICGPVFKDISHLAAPFFEKLYKTSSHESPSQKHHTAENPLKRDKDRTLFEKNREEL